MKTVAGGKPSSTAWTRSLALRSRSPAWHTKLAGLPWNERNKDKAKRLLQEAGYKREPIRFMTTQEYKWMYDFALLTKQQLEDVGFNIDLQVVDWATLGQAAQQAQGVRRLHHRHRERPTTRRTTSTSPPAGRAGPSTRAS